MSEKTSRDILKNALRTSVAGTTVYVVDHASLRRGLADGTASSIVLDNADYTDLDSDLVSSRLEVVQRTNSEAKKTWRYYGSIEFSDDANVTKDEYFEALQELLKDQSDYGLHTSLFNNVRLLNHSSTSTMAAVAFYAASNSVEYKNEYSGTGSTGAWQYAAMSVEAPSLEKIGTDGRDRQFQQHLRGYLFSLTALARAVKHGQRAFDVSVVSKGDKVLYSEGTTQSENTEVPAEPVESVEHESQPEKKGVMLDDIGGYEAIKTDMKHLVYSYKHPDALKRWGAERPQAVLLYGPPGTGKTTFAQAVANELEGELWEIQASGIYGKWLGESEKSIDALFDEAEKKSSPTVMLFDEFEGIINTPADTSGGNGARVNVAAIFKKRLAGLREKNPNVVVFATTNDVESIDESLVRVGRFDKKHYVPLPDTQARMAIFGDRIGAAFVQLGTKDFSPFTADVDPTKLAEATDGMSGADIVEVLRRAQFEKAMASSSDAISQADLLRHARDLRQG